MFRSSAIEIHKSEFRWISRPLASKCLPVEYSLRRRSSASSKTWSWNWRRFCREEAPRPREKCDREDTVAHTHSHSQTQMCEADMDKDSPSCVYGLSSCSRDKSNRSDAEKKKREKKNTHTHFFKKKSLQRGPYLRWWARQTPTRVHPKLTNCQTAAGNPFPNYLKTVPVVVLPKIATQIGIVSSMIPRAKQKSETKLTASILRERENNNNNKNNNKQTNKRSKHKRVKKN